MEHELPIKRILEKLLPLAKRTLEQEENSLREIQKRKCEFLESCKGFKVPFIKIRIFSKPDHLVQEQLENFNSFIFRTENYINYYKQLIDECEEFIKEK
jgi:hypothetical protein